MVEIKQKQSFDLASAFNEIQRQINELKEKNYDEKITALENRINEKPQEPLKTGEVIKGPQGSKGEGGLQGHKGLDGKNGLDGKQGIPGLKGKDGIDGKCETINYQVITDSVIEKIMPMIYRKIEDNKKPKRWFQFWKRG